jgi:UDP-N-acetylmuramate--alanine ligase
MPEDHVLLQYFRHHGFTIYKRAQVLGMLTRTSKGLCAAGTHGKTTTSSMAAHLLYQSHVGCDAFLGGISKNYGTNLLLSDKSEYVVIEADEFDRSFLQLFPEYAAITAIDADHLDIYGDLAHIQEAFNDFAAQVSKQIVVKYGVEIDKSKTKAQVFSYSFDDERADYYASNLRKDECGYFDFTLVYPGGKIENCRVDIPGWVNVENAVAASALALAAGVKEESLRKALRSFSGVKRRFDLHVNRPGCAYIDDYAHHPNEIAAAIKAIRDMFPSRKLTAIFQPHLYTRTRDFAVEFAQALSQADKVILLDIYPAREEPIPGVSSEIIFNRITAKEKCLINKEELMGVLAKEEKDVWVSFGAGNIDRYVPAITALLTNE